MSVLAIEIARGQTVFAPGDTLSGSAAWELDDPTKPVEVRLFWYTRGKGTRDVGVIETTTFDMPPRTGRREFRFKLPESPHSFSGRLISLSWAVEVVCGSESSRCDFVLSASGAEIDLTSNQTGEKK